MRTLKRRRRRAGADSNCASVLAAVGSHQRPSFPQVGTPGPIKCKGKVPKPTNKDLPSNSRERGSLPVGPHPRLFFRPSSGSRLRYDGDQFQVWRPKAGRRRGLRCFVCLYRTQAAAGTAPTPSDSDAIGLSGTKMAQARRGASILAFRLRTQRHSSVLAPGRHHTGTLITVTSHVTSIWCV